MRNRDTVDLRDDPSALMETLEWPALPELLDQLLADEERSRAVEAMLDLVDVPDDTLDRLTRLAAAALDMPMSAITLVESGRQVFVGRLGLPVRTTGLDRSYCKYATAAGRTMAIRDSATDRVLRENPATREDGVRSYLGVPLVDHAGHALGTVCAFGTEPHEWTPRDLAVMNLVSHAVMSELELRVARRRRALG